VTAPVESANNQFCSNLYQSSTLINIAIGDQGVDKEDLGLLDLASQHFGVQVPTQKDRFDGLAQLCESQVSGMFEATAGKALQNRFGLCCALA
jgi:hypothetical protein